MKQSKNEKSRNSIFVCSFGKYMKRNIWYHERRRSTAAAVTISNQIRCLFFVPNEISERSCKHNTHSRSFGGKHRQKWETISMHIQFTNILSVAPLQPHHRALRFHFAIYEYIYVWMKEIKCEARQNEPAQSVSQPTSQTATTITSKSN